MIINTIMAHVPTLYAYIHTCTFAYLHNVYVYVHMYIFIAIVSIWTAHGRL